MRTLCSRKKTLAVLIVLLLVTSTYFMLQIIFVQFRTSIYASINVNQWMESRFEACNGMFTGYGDEFAILRNATILPQSSEWCLPAACDLKEISGYTFQFGKEGTHLNKWLPAVKQCEKVSWYSDRLDLNTAIAIAVQRYEYLNLYHTMTDWYNVFLVMKLLNLSINDVTIVLLDRHPTGSLDIVWQRLFDNVVFWNTSRPLHFKEIIWNILGYESPMNFHRIPNLPFVEQFSHFFLQRHGFKKSKTLDCKNISVVFSFRRDYYSSPNTPIRILWRKIENEQELVRYFSTNYNNLHVSGFQLDQLSFNDQLNLITNTDILISMHGAGLSHIMFLPKHAGVIELFPLYWTRYSTVHFRAFSRWRGLKYSSYQNLNPTNEFADYKTYIPPTSLAQNVQYVLSEMCDKK